MNVDEYMTHFDAIEIELACTMRAIVYSVWNRYATCKWYYVVSCGLAARARAYIRWAPSLFVV